MNLMSVQSLSQINNEPTESGDSSLSEGNTFTLSARDSRKEDELEKLVKLKVLQLPESLYH